MTTFNCLSLEMKILIFQKLNRSSRLTCKLVCTEWLEILMLGIEFKNDRALKFSKCYYETNRLPVSLFENLSYNTYFCKFLNINTNNTMDFDNIPTVFWSTLENNLFYLKIDSVDLCFYGRKFFSLFNKLISKCKLTGLHFNSYYNIIDLYNFVKNNHPLFNYNIIERIFIDNISSNSYNNNLKDKILFLFPNLKILTFKKFQLNFNFNANYENCIGTPYTLNIDTIYIDKFKQIINVQFLPPHNSIVSNRDFKEYSKFTCAKFNDRINFEYISYTDKNVNIRWNPYLKVEYMRIIIKSSFCFFTHEPINAYYLKRLNLEFTSTIYCDLCYKNLLQNIHNIEEITIKCYNKQNFISFDVIVSNIVKYCNKNLKTFNYVSIYEHPSNLTIISFDGCLNIETLNLNIKNWIYIDQLKCLHIKFPKLKNIIIDFYEMNVQSIIEDILCNSNNALEKIKINNNNYSMKQIITSREVTNKISTLLLQHGPKMRVSN